MDELEKWDSGRVPVALNMMDELEKWDSGRVPVALNN